MTATPVNNELLPLTASGLCYGKPHDYLIDHLDLYINSPGITVILGPNGAGKSRLLRLVHGLLTPAEGSIHWGHIAPGPEVRLNQALVFQKPVLLRRTTRQNMEYVLQLEQCSAGIEQIDELLNLVGLSQHADQPARSLSGGEQQRLCLARALALDPGVLLLDEATASLDPASVAIIENILKEKRGQGAKIILVTHDLAQAKRMADDVVFMHRGKVVENTPASSFFQRPETPVAQAYLAGQLIH